VPQRLLDDLEVYRVMHPPIGEGFIFRTEQGRPLDPDNWHHRRLVPILEQAKLRLPKSGLHSLRHSYVSLLAAQGEDIHYISRQVGHSSTQLTQDVYRHVFAKTRAAAMQRLDRWVPLGSEEPVPSGAHPASQAETAGTGGNTE
jgi:integrase